MLRLTRWTSLMFAIIALNPLIAGADSTGMFAPERVGRWYIGGGLGGFREESNSQVQNQDGQYGSFFSGGYRLHPNIALEIDGLYSSQKMDTPPTIPNSTGRTQLHSAGAGGIVKFILPLDRVELYAGGGLGLYTSQLRVDASPDDIRQEDENNIGYQALVGADFFVSRYVSVGMEYRRFKLDADFGATIPGKIDAGGDFLFATVRGHF
ncbi:MAG: porin family protein [Betaproteobacteria bacterium]|nr:porin family protein [Betaproteobacteria bacterium]